MLLEQVAIATIKEYELNARTHSVDQVGQIAESIRQFGFTNPVLIDKANVLIAGHGRLAAARLLNMDTVPAVRLSGLTDSQVRALRIADNKIAMNSGWNLEVLTAELQALALVNFDLSVTGFAIEELKALADNADAEIDQIDAKYTRKITAPIYEPKGDKPTLSELFDVTKTNELLAEIRSASLPGTIKTFLEAAAMRHTVFDFAKIAEYYAHSDADTQRLFERSALVIIDFDKAIENGFVKLAHNIADTYRTDHRGKTDAG